MPTGLLNSAAFFATIRGQRALGPSLTSDEVAGCNAILMACGSANWPATWTAYALATAVVETNHTMRPIVEMGGNAYFMRYDIRGPRPDKAKELGNLLVGDGARYCGRGYVQITGRKNYQKAQDKLGVPLVEQPGLALDPQIAARIMVRGMAEGWFTGANLAKYLPRGAAPNMYAFTSCRRIINGTDRAVEIAEYAMNFYRALVAGSWM